jgi:hypothetical protein
MDIDTRLNVVNKPIVNTCFKATVRRCNYPAEVYWFDAMWGNYGQGGGYIGMLPLGETDKSKRDMVDPTDCDIEYLPPTADEEA